MYRRTWIDHTTEIGANSAEIMAALMDIDAWPSWTPGLVGVTHSPGPLVPGSRFTMQVKPAAFHPPMRVPCKVFQANPTFVEWGGDLLGSVVRHSFELTPLDATRTRVRQVEYATGLLARLLRIAEPGIYKHNFAWQKALSARVERAHLTTN